MSFSTIVKCISTMRQLAYGKAPDAFDEYLQIGFMCRGWNPDFLSQKEGGGRGVKEKQHGSANDTAKDTFNVEGFKFSYFIYTRGNGVDVVVSVESIRVICERNTWGKYDLVKSMLNSSTMLFSFQFSSMDGLNAMLENGPWFIRNHQLILKKWKPNVNLLKEDVGNVLIWVKLHGVPVMASSYARAMIELRADVELKDTIVVTMPKLTREGFYTCIVRVEYEWKPPRCACCKIFGHIQEECPKNPGLGVAKNLKKPSHATRGVPVGSKMGFKPVKQAYKPIFTKPTAHTSGNK
nr:hypothetical protein [Tanacetum cinerariifolium]